MSEEGSAVGPDVKEQGGKLLAHIAGYVGFRTVEMGLTFGLFDEIRNHPDGVSPADLASSRGLDPFYVEVWCRSAYAAEILDGDGRTYRLAPHVETLLLDPDSPAYAVGSFLVLGKPEVFDRFAEKLSSGEGTWWDQCGPEFIRGVAESGRAFYNRLIPGGFARVPGLTERLEGGAAVLELACGVGTGMAKLARAFPRCRTIGVDGDAYSLDLARENLRSAGTEAELVHSPLEDIDWEDAFDAAFINISMHECRDIEKVTAKVHRALKRDGIFVISDFPFPPSANELRTPPARFMSGIQFFEALIGDQLLSTAEFVALLERHGFREVDAFDLTPVHAVTHGRR